MKTKVLQGVLLLTLVVLVLPGLVLAATATVTPNKIPNGATASNDFRQQIFIDFAELFTGQAGVDITITPPSGVTISDNGDGYAAGGNDIFVEVENGGGTAAAVTATPAAGSITLDLGTGTITSTGFIYVTFDVVVSETPTFGATTYSIAFVGGSGVTSPITASVTITPKGQLNLVTFTEPSGGDTTTASGGSGDSFALTTPALLDYVVDVTAGVDATTGTLAATGVSGISNTDDITYDFWFATDSTLTNANAVNAIHALTTAGASLTNNEGGTGGTAGLQSLPTGTYYVYVTSNGTGTFTLGRSGYLVVTHKPFIKVAGWDFDASGSIDDNDDGVINAADGVTIYLDSGQFVDKDDGGTNGATLASDNVNLRWTIADYDDNAKIKVFFSTTNNLSESNVTTSGSSPSLTVTGLTGATLIAKSDTLRENEDVSFNFDVFSSADTVDAGDYYMYFVADDGKNFDVFQVNNGSGTNIQFHVRHSPDMNLDALDATSITTSTTRFLMITWGKTGVNGDVDIDNNATISLYIDADTGGDGLADFDRSTVSSLADADSTDGDLTDGELIVSGLKEDPDGMDDNDYAWDLWSSGTAALLAAATNYHVYAIISDGSVNRLVAVGDGADNSVGAAENITEVAFTHAPTAVLLAPPADGMTVNARDAYQIKFTAQLLGDAAQMLVVLSSTNYGATSDATVLLDADAAAEQDWILNSTDGSFANRQVLTEGTDVSYNIQIKKFGSATSYLTTDNDATAPGELSAPVDGTYFLYLIIDDGDDNFTEAADVAIRAPGTIKVIGVADDPPIEYLAVSPTVFTTVLGDTVTLTFQGVDNANTVDLIDAYVSVDTTLFRIVNPSAPFTSILSGGGVSAIKNTVITDSTLGSRKLLNLTLFAAGSPIALANTNASPTTLGTFRLVSRGTTAAVTQSSDISLVRSSTYKTAFYNDGGEVTISYRSPVSAGMVSPRGQLVGIGNLQSRTSSAVAFTLELRQPGNYDPISDATFESSNDDSSGVSGLQVVADADGRFTLTQIPSGVYDLVIHYDRYLDVKQSVTITPATDAVLVNFGILLGGDAGGFTDVTGVDMPDNEVTATGDLDKIANNFGATPSSASWNNNTKAKFADINESGMVDIVDLTIASSNLTSQGAQPVFKPVEGDNTGAAVLLVGLPTEIRKGQVYDVNVVVNQFTGLRGYDLDLGYDPALFTVGQVKRGTVFTRSYSFSTTGEGEVGVVNALIGREVPSATNAVLMTVRLTARRDAHGLTNPVWVKGARLVDALYRPMDVAGVRMTAAQVPTAFALDQNYPNPFNPETVIRIHLPEDGAVTLKIYNLLGQEIRTLLRTPMTAGIYNVTWDGLDHSGRAVSSGVYFYRVTAGQYTDTKRMVLLR